MTWTFNKDNNYIGCSEKQKKFTKYIAKAHPSINLIAAVHDAFYNILIKWFKEFPYLFFLAKLIVDIGLFWIIGSLYCLFNKFNIMKSVTEVWLLTIFVFAILIYTPKYIHNVYKNEN